jgi:hypothetical protein
MIATLRQTTTGTRMPTLRKRLRYSLPADAGLACAAWVHFDKHAPGALSLVRKFIQEATPTDIVDGLGQHAPGHPFDIEVFDGNHAVVIHQGSGDFVVKVVALMLDVGMLTRQNCHCLTPSMGPVVGSPRNPALSHAQSSLRLAVEAKVVDFRSLAQCGEGGESKVNTNRLARYRQRLGSALYREDHKPATRLTFDRNCLDCSFHRSMQLDLDDSPTLNANRAVDKFAAVIVGREGEGILPAAGLEAREACLLAAFDPGKEGCEGLVQPSQHILAAGEVGDSNQVLRPHGLQLLGLVVVADRLAAQLPRSHTLFQRSIVEIARLPKLERQGLGLLTIRVYAVLEGNTHSHTFLLRHVLLNGGCSDRTYGTREIPTTPESRKTASEPREFLTKNPATVSLEPVHNLSHTVGRVVLNKEVDVIRHDFHGMQRETVLSSLFVQDPLPSLIDTADQHGETILWTPYQMYLQCENRTGVLCIPFHVILYTRRINTTQAACDPAAS